MFQWFPQWRKAEPPQTPLNGETFSGPVANKLCRCRSSRPSHESAAIDYVAGSWPVLPPHVKEAILTLVDAATTKHFGRAER
jgi:hypothetical protein